MLVMELATDIDIREDGSHIVDNGRLGLPNDGIAGHFERRREVIVLVEV